MINPDLYRLSNSLQRREATECLEKLAPKMTWKKTSNRIIDVGCGDGSVTNILTKYLPVNFKLLGSDINVIMVTYANEHNRNAQTSFAVLDIAGELPEEMKGSFDHVFSFFVFSWVQNQEQAFKNIFYLLEENGECFLIFLASNSFHKFLRAMSLKSKWSPWIQNVEEYISPYYDSKEPDMEIVKLMESIGFIDIKVECEDKVFMYDDMHLFKNHFIATNPFKIPDEMFDDYYDNYMQMLRETEIAHDVKKSPNNINFYYKILKVYGHKPSA